MGRVDELIDEVLDRGFEIRVHRWDGPAVTITDPDDPRGGGCSSLRGEGSGNTYEAAMIDACTQAINDRWPQATACGRAVAQVGNNWTTCVLGKIHDGLCRDANGTWGKD